MTSLENTRKGPDAGRGGGQPTEAAGAGPASGGVPVVPVVGVGAPAGGLQAFADLLTHLPPDTGMAFVLVQPLDSDHGRVLTEILARNVRLPVLPAVHGLRLEPDHIYVLPSGATTSLVDGAFRILPEQWPSAPGRAEDASGEKPRVSDETGASVSPAGETDSSIPPHAGTVLLVEDETALLDAMRGAMEAKGYRVLCASDGYEALDLHARSAERIDVAVIDLILPKLDGWQTFLRIKARAPAVKTILTTSVVDEGQRDRMIEAGVDAVLRKPYTAQGLLEALAQVHHRSSAA